MTYPRRSAFWPIGLLFAVLIVLLVGYIISGQLQTHSTGRLVDQKTSTPPCASPDTSFCKTEAQFITYVYARDAADILENQLSTPVVCSNHAPAGCNGATNGLTVQLFAMQQNSKSELLTRNDYINELRTFLRQYGPFVFAHDDSTSNTVTMVFYGHNTSVALLLEFHKQDGAWKLAVSTLTT